MTNATSSFALRTERLGPLPLINHFIDRLGVADVLERFVPTDDRRCRLSHAQGLGVLLRSIIVEREPIYRQGETVQDFAPGLFGVPAGEVEGLADDRIGRALDRLFDANCGALLTEVVVQALAPHAKIRALIVPHPVLALATELEEAPQAAPERPERVKRWAELLARVFGLDMQSCAQCGGPFKIIAAILDPHAIQAILTHLKLPDKPPGLAPARIRHTTVERLSCGVPEQIPLHTTGGERLCGAHFS